MSRSRYPALWTALLLLLISPHALSHKSSDSYLYWQSQQPQIMRLDIALSDWQNHAGLDPNGDGQVTAYELDRQSTYLGAIVQRHIVISHAGKRCGYSPQLSGVTHYSDGLYSSWQLLIQCPVLNPDSLTINYSLFFDRDILHRSLVFIEQLGQQRLQVISPSRPLLQLSQQPSALSNVLPFFYQGALHMWLGADHILFLITLLMLVLIDRRDGTWRPLANPTRGFKHLLWVITAFTLAHSITLIISSLQLLTLRSTPVEIVIALSIAFTAVKLLWPVIRINTVVISFTFGLIHGMGFAGMLGELLNETSSRILAILSFNLGIEAAQIVLVLLAYPIIQRLLKQQWAKPVFQYTTTSILAISLLWTFERSLAL